MASAQATDIKSNKLDDETTKLQNRVQQQLDRLLLQLQDCEDLKEDLDDEEYEETRQDTLKQLEEFQVALDQMCKGNLSLRSSLEHVRDAIRAAVSETFQTPDIISFFVKRQPQQLRQRLEKLHQSYRLKDMGEDEYIEQACEVLMALQHLGEDLSPLEQRMLSQYHESAFRSDFEAVPSDPARGKGKGSSQGTNTGGRMDNEEKGGEGDNAQGTMGKRREILGVANTQIRQASQRHGEENKDDDE
eukprot:gb/GECH01013881.1/.p1 GENE.gb/GECH01013881.1/~~gb/GECH01013881.1/.p1  ORF type:complete len:246 (+),score=52.65 gb/GECH01013881.1/:1-738(+)